MTTYERRWWWVKEKKQMALVFLTITMMLQLQMKGCVGCIETERTGLLELKSYLNSQLLPREKGILKSWTYDDHRNGDCCKWERVKCEDAVGGHIIELSLYEIMGDDMDILRSPRQRSLNLSLLHSFPRLQTFNFSKNWFQNLFDPFHGYKSFHRLEKLRTLGLSLNGLNNSVLPFLSAARSLRTLDLSGNHLEGVFPPNEFGNMPKLKVLTLPVNEFTSFSGKGLINFSKLEVLDLSFNKISDFDAGNGLKSTKLKSLNLNVNEFSGIGQLKGLEHLEELVFLTLRYNRFNNTGSIHEVFKDMPKLLELNLSDNEFTDLDLVLPSSLQVLDLNGNHLSLTPKGYSEICRARDLRELDISSNALTKMPKCLGNLSRLRTLDLSYNQLDGDLSSFVSGLPSALEFLSLDNNNFNGSFLFNSLVNQTRLKVFLVTSRVGTIQARAESSWVPLFQLEMLTLSNFNLGSTIPGFLVHQHDFSLVDLSNNKLTGAFPAWLVQNNTRMQMLFLNSNLLTELQLPRLVHGLRLLDISSNMIYDSIQEDLGIVFPNLEFMNLSSNHFYGTIPSSMGEMKSLRRLDMSFNGLSGQLPEILLSGCYSLTFLKLSNNQFWGEILSEHANFTGLVWLSLYGNNFSGSLGKGLLNLENLSVLEISDNSISGALPLWIGRMSSLVCLYIGGNQLKGSFPGKLQNLQFLEVLDISHNSFSGSIPKNVHLPNLTELRLQSNEFIGTIPGTLFKAKRLHVLDLGNNNLSGVLSNRNLDSSDLRVLILRNNSLQGYIPESLCQLQNLSLVDLSHNKFKGVIPSCFNNMFSGAKDSWHFYSTTQLMSYPQLRNWSYNSALFVSEDNLRPGTATLTTIINFLTKSRYESYQGYVIEDMHGLDLSSNQLSGEIPFEIGDLQYIRSLNLSSNRLTGSIPSSISKLKDLESLDLSNNKLDGKIPHQLAGLNSLGYLDVSHNNLSGEIPFKGHLGSFDEKSYIGNAHLCGLPTNTSCNRTRSLEPKEAKEEEEEEDGDGAIDMVWFYWTCGAVYISTVFSLFVFLCIDTCWSREWFYRVNLVIHHLQRLKARRFLCN